MTEQRAPYGDEPEPEPLSEHELAQLEASAGVAGLSSVDARRLIAEIRRLRGLVQGASRLLTPGAANIETKEAHRLYDSIKAEADRA